MLGIEGTQGQVGERDRERERERVGGEKGEQMWREGGRERDRKRKRLGRGETDTQRDEKERTVQKRVLKETDRENIS